MARAARKSVPPTEKPQRDRRSLERVRKMIVQTLDSAVASCKDGDWERAEAQVTRLAEQLRQEPPALQAFAVSLCLGEAVAALGKQKHKEVGLWASDDPMTWRRDLATRPCDTLLRRVLPFADDELVVVVRAKHTGLLSTTTGFLLRQIERALGKRRASPELLKELKAWLAAFGVGYREDGVALRARLVTLIEPGGATAPTGRTRRRCPDAQVERHLLAEALHAGEAAHLRRPYAMSAIITPEQALDRSDAERARLMARISTRVPYTVHIAAFAVPRPGFAPVRAFCPEFAALAEALLKSVAGLPDELILQGERDVPFNERYISPTRGPDIALQMIEALWAAGLARASLIERVRQQLLEANTRTDCPSWGRHLESLEDRAGAPYPHIVRPDDAWSDAAIAKLKLMRGHERRGWLDLLAHCEAATWSKPPKRWLDKARPHVESLRERGREHLLAWLSKVGLAGTRERNLYGWPWDPTIMHEANATLLRALIFAWATAPSPELAAALGDAALACDQTVLHQGPRCVIVRNAAIAALSGMPADIAGAQLGRLHQMLKYKAGTSMGQKAVAEAARATGASPEEFLESAVPDYGLRSDGTLEISVGAYTAHLTVDARWCVSVAWSRGSEALEQPPESEGDGTARVQRRAREIERMLEAQRLRLERLLASTRSWTLPEFKRLYLDHPLLRTIARALIWNLQDGTTQAAMFAPDGWVGYDGAPVHSDEHTVIRPWHPAAAAVADVVAWRRHIESRSIRQPFKQAHREVYLLTDAERATRTYSNRFAAHVVRSAQLGAMLRLRGWTGNPASTFDTSQTPATLALPELNLEVEFATSEGHEEPDGRGFFPLLATDRVVFRAPGHPQGVPLESVPPLVFSEVMRDVDLFVGVCSVGNNPAWHDGGPQARLHEYWWRFSFGELSAAGESRREVLEHLLPRLSIANACALHGRFLHVRGTLRTYKIHLGSGNILMEPNDEYLCIIPSRQDAEGKSIEHVYLPFEGDTTLAVILSKAFLLAADDRITDTSIARQIKLTQRPRP